MNPSVVTKANVKNSRFAIIANTIHAIVKWLAISGAVCTCLMMLLIVSNIVGRFVFKQPLLGTLELVDFMTVTAAFFAIAYAEYKKTNVKVDLLVEHFPRSARKITELIMNILCAAFCLGMSWQACQLVRDALSPMVRESSLLSIPLAPFMFFVALGSFLLAIEMLLNIFHPATKQAESGNI